MHGHAAQLLGPQPEQAECRRRGIEKAAVGAVPGDQVGGVLDNQAVQAPGAAGLAGALTLCAGITATRQHPLALVLRDEGPQQCALAKVHFDIGNRPVLAQARTH